MVVQTKLFPTLSMVDESGAVKPEFYERPYGEQPQQNIVQTVGGPSTDAPVPATAAPVASDVIVVSNKEYTLRYRKRGQVVNLSVSWHHRHGGL